MRLKLELVERQKEAAEARSVAAEREWAIERERMELQAQSNNAKAPSATRVRSDIQHILPKMSNNEDDVLNFLGRTKELCS